eukprot:gene159-267_t
MSGVDTLLFRTWKYVCISATALYVVLQLIFLVSHIYLQDYVCSDDDFSPWVAEVRVMIISCFVVVSAIVFGKAHINRDFSEKNSEISGNLALTATVCLISGCSTSMTHFWNWGGVCSDVFGVKAAASRLSEWMICVPLLILSCISSVICGYYFLKSAREHFSKVHLSTDPISCKQANIRYKLTLWLFATMPLFPIVYFLAFFRVIDNDMSECLFMGLSLITKLFFNILSMDIHVYHVEVRVPLSSISMGLDLINGLKINEIVDNDDKAAADDDDEESNLLSNTLVMMKDASTAMGDTLDNVLAIQVIEEGLFEIVRAPFHIKNMIENAISTFQMHINNKLITIDIKLSENIPNYIVGDCIRIENAFKVLICNAITYSPKSSKIVVSISISNSISKSSHRIFPILTNNCILSMTVQDTGPGIAPQQLKQLFKPFVHLRQGTNMTQSKSSGVSLFVAKQIIERHGGTLECTSAVGKGSAFRITVPVTIASEEQFTSLAVDNHIEVGDELSSSIHTISNNNSNDNNNNNVFTAIGFKRKFALVVDDMVSCRKLLGYLLRREGFCVYEASDGLQALNSVHLHPSHYEVIFMDNTMPNMTGVEATVAIRKLGYSNLIIGVTGNAMEDDVKAFLRAGADMIFAKPFKLEHLHALIAHSNINGCESDPTKKFRLHNNVVEKMPNWG